MNGCRRHQISGGTVKKIIITGALVAAAGLGLTACGSQSAPASHPAPVASHSVAAAPTTAAPSTPAPVPVTRTFSGRGKGSTPTFTSVGSFTVSWTFKGNVDVTQWATGTTSSPDNFSISMFSSAPEEVGQVNQDLAFNDPNEVQASDSGNQTISGDDGTHYFTVDSGTACAWTFTVVTQSYTGAPGPPLSVG